MRVICHAGFHKTGTTTLQQGLALNRDALSRHLRLVPRGRSAAAGRTARAWSEARDPLEMALFRYELAVLMTRWNRRDPRPIMLSAEDLAGHMPGRHGVADYGAAPALMQAVVATLAEIAPEAEPVFYFSTRAPEAWLASCHAQHLRATRMRLDADSFAERHRAAADLPAMVAQIAEAVAPVPVHHTALEQSRDRALGPLDPLLDLCDLPPAARAGLIAPPMANRAAPADCTAALLRLNRSDRDDAEVHAAKQALLAALP
ncbi:hypothetical protein [Pseudodonghicola flavimaris]|uniref:Sulfotransferase family protein n=1 Tax=Pseudodonghicola flavimaris TaxID=3050036 RepID=A0ABT7F6Q6_9RHOB|nr:hypothetical protein [Pseudodonghicola flavimaris]MDK3020277.1 hypothetical protein [Pseudodonghicola flavimaris]